MQIKRINKNEIDQYYSLLKQDFCYDERKTKKDELKAFDDNRFNPMWIYENNQVIGYFSYWEFDEFIFGEHFAVIKELRNKGYGTRFLKEILQTINKTLLIEVECPTNIISKRRINFYKRIGFQLNTNYNYIQPQYHNNNHDVPLIITTYPEKINEQQYKKYTQQIREVVYGK